MTSSSLWSRAARRAGATLVLLLVSALLAPVVGSGSAEAQDSPQDTLKELKERREQLREEREAAAADVDIAQGEFDDVTTVLQAIEDDVAAQEARVRTAQQAAQAAQGAVAATDDRIAEVRDSATEIDNGIRQLAVEMYIGRSDGGDARAALVLASDDPLEVSRRVALLDARIGVQTDIGDRLRELNDDLEFLRRERTDAVDAADAREAELEVELAALDDARDAQVDVVDAAEDRLERRLAEAAALEEQDQEVAAQIRKTEAEIAAALARARAAAAARAPRAPRGSGPRIDPVPISETVIAGGFRVHVSVASNVEAMVAAAAADGINLGGGGWRDTARQIQLRRAHCGTSDFAIYEMRSSRCRPPTARPGHSMHERGMALDITCNGALIRSRNNSCFQWLALNAASYGFYNLPSEPWHWSVNGQ